MTMKKKPGHIPLSTQYSPETHREQHKHCSRSEKYSNYDALENLEKPRESQENKKHP